MNMRKERKYNRKKLQQKRIEGNYKRKKPKQKELKKTKTTNHKKPSTKNLQLLDLQRFEPKRSTNKDEQ